ncbi:MAG: TetR/AcrR family transcriptional regulator [Bacteroidia bacterium]|nr:TetR/AcrR family transcriptional regulator [Bacteroidia bacterium]
MNDVSVRLHLLITSRKLFLKFGYSKVTMDEIAREMGMSKKTIYLYFPGKLKLMEEVIEEMKNEITQGVHKILADTSLSTLEKLKQVMIFTADFLSSVSPFVATDLERNVPELWDKLKSVKYELAFSNIKKLLKECIASGIIRKDISPDLLLMFYSSAFQHVRDSAFLNDFPKDIRQQIPSTGEQVFSEWVKICFEGLER